MVVIESLKLLANAGSLRATAVVNISDRIRISDIHVVRQEGKAAWVAFPARSYEAGGKKKWAAIVEILDEDLKRKIADAVLAEFEKLDAADRKSAAPATKQPAGW